MCIVATVAHLSYCWALVQTVAQTSVSRSKNLVTAQIFDLLTDCWPCWLMLRRYSALSTYTEYALLNEGRDIISHHRIIHSHGKGQFLCRPCAVTSLWMIVIKAKRHESRPCHSSVYEQFSTGFSRRFPVVRVSWNRNWFFASCYFYAEWSLRFVYFLHLWRSYIYMRRALFCLTIDVAVVCVCLLHRWCRIMGNDLCSTLGGPVVYRYWRKAWTNGKTAQ